MSRELVEGEQRRRRTQSKQDRQTTRYECFCSKQYLSYPALYLHIRNKHVTYFQKSKGEKKSDTSRLIETVDKQEGFKVFKMPISSFSIQEDPQLPPYSHHSHPQEQELLPDLEPRETEKDSVSIQSMFTSFMNYYIKEEGKDTDRASNAKERMQIELFLSLVIRCLNQHYDKLGDPRVSGRSNLERYTAQYSSEFVPEIFPFFQQIFMPSLKTNSLFCFFLTNSQIVQSQSYRKLLDKLRDYIEQETMGDDGEKGDGERQPYKEKI